MNDEEVAKLNHTLEAVAEHARLQGQRFHWSPQQTYFDGAVYVIKFRPVVGTFGLELCFEVTGGTRDEVLAAIQNTMQEVHTSLGKFLGERI